MSSTPDAAACDGTCDTDHDRVREGVLESVDESVDKSADYGTREREREYSPSSCIGGNYQPFIDAYRSRSLCARADCVDLGARWLTLRYGSATAQQIELCLPPPRPLGDAQKTALLVFIHGGYWQELSAQDSLFAATGCIAAGHAFAAIDYTLAPVVTVAQIVDECRRAVACLAAQADPLGIDAQRIVLAGSSAGAHLAAMVALREWSDWPDSSAARPRPCAIRAAVLVSGIYALAPLIGTSINTALGLDLASARASSPSLLPLHDFPRTVVCWGEVETNAFKQQSRAFAELLGDTQCTSFEVAARNHFDVILDLTDASTQLGRATLDLLQT